MAKYKKDLFEALNFETAPTYRLVCPAEIIASEGHWPDGKPKPNQAKVTLDELWPGGEAARFYYFDEKFYHRMGEKGITPGSTFQMYRQGQGKDSRYYMQVLEQATQAPPTPGSQVAPPPGPAQGLTITPAAPTGFTPPSAAASPYEVSALLGWCLSEAIELWKNSGLDHNCDNIQATASTLFIQTAKMGLYSSIAETPVLTNATPQATPNNAPPALPPQEEDLPF
jgi:hypothetical protein